MADEPKLIIDSDWKSSAQAEKEKLALKAAPKPGPAGAQGELGDENRPITFDDLVGMLATQALSYMGYVPDPYTGQAMVSLEYAKLHVDLLGILETKTKGNLSPDEQASLDKTLTQLRSAFVEISIAVTKAVKEGKVKPVKMGGPGGEAMMPGPVGGPMGGFTGGSGGGSASGLGGGASPGGLVMP